MNKITIRMTLKLLVSSLCLLWATSAYSQQLGFDQSEQSVWEKHQSEIENNAQFLIEDLLFQMDNSYMIPSSKKSKIDQYVQDKERKKYLCNYKQYEHLSDRIKEKTKIDSLYQDSIFAILVPYNPQMTGQAISLALFFAEELALSQENTAILTAKAVDFARRVHKNPCEFFAVEEMLVLKQILSSTQLDAILEEKNSKKAKEKALQAWEALKYEGLTYDLDSINDIGRAFLYYRSEMSIRDYYVDNKELQENNLADIYRHKPRIIQMYDGLWQRKQINKKYEKKVGAEFSW